MKYIKKILFIILTITIIFISYISLNPLVIKHPNKGYTLDLKDKNINYENTLATLENLTKKPHPTWDNEEEYKYITDYLNKIGVNFRLDEYTMDYNLYKEYYLFQTENDPNKESILKEFGVDDIKSSGYNSYAEFLWENALKYASKEKTLDELIKRQYDEFSSNFKDNKIIIKNILVELGDIDNNKESIVFSSHYDSGLTIDTKKTESYGAGDDGIAISSLLENIRVHKNDMFNNNVYILINEGEENNLYGSYLFMRNKEVENIKLAINIDNASNKGHLALYRSSNNKNIIFNKYLKATKSIYSFSIYDKLYKLFNLNYESDFDNYKLYDIDTIDLALFVKNDDYHTKDDNYDNISIDSLNETTDTVNNLINYFGNDTDKYKEDKGISIPLLFMNLNINESIYFISISILLIISLILFIIFSIKKKYKLKDFIVMLCYITLTIIVYLNIKELIFITLIPIISISILPLYKEKTANNINTVLYFIELSIIGVIISLIISITNNYLSLSLILLPLSLIPNYKR